MYDESVPGRLASKNILGLSLNFNNVQRLFLLSALVVVIISMTLLNPRFLSWGNIININRQMSINLIIAVAMTYCIISGGFDLSVGSVGAMAGCLTGIILESTGNIPLAIAAGLASGGIVGIANGFVIAKLNVPPFVATLGTMSAARGVALLVTGGIIISGFPDSFNFIGTGFIFGIPVPVIIMVIVVVIGHIVLSKTEFGLNVYALGGNFKASRLAGLENDKMIMKIYTLSGLLSAMAGIILTARVISAQPGLMQTTNLDVIAAVVVGGSSLAGGKGSIGNTILGSILMAALFNGLNIIGIGYEWQLVVIGIIVIMAVALDMISRKNEI
jgi:ribose transport system permease protein